jgi:hypothetical protein
MSKSEGDQDVSRRRLLKKAALAVGAATSVVAARTALARSCDVAMDSAGRVLIHGAGLRAPEGSFEVARASNEGNCINSSSCGGTVNGGACSNQKTCLLPSRAMQPTGAGPKVNAPVGGNALTGPKLNAPLGGNSLTSPKLNAPLGGNTRK